MIKKQEVIAVQIEHTEVCLGKVIKTARTLKGMTQPQLALTLGITTRYLKLIENSGRKPSYKLLVCIVKELDIPFIHSDSKKS